MANEAISEGDVVRLRSGGAEMTVENVSGDYAECVWSDGKKVYRDAFKITLLIKPSDYPPDYFGIG
jgi:uncharacterized protein YodC (DUF2158 family)